MTCHVAGGTTDAGQRMLAWAKKLAPNLRVAPSVGYNLKNGVKTAALSSIFTSKGAELLLVAGYSPGLDGGHNDFTQASVSSMSSTANQAEARALVAAAAAAGATLVHDASFADWEEALDDVAATSLPI